ncbi:TonB-dependent siderophore receptor [Pseudomonas sp. Gutcm_11s]|uniref:TonB-dependent siderophore receptor n=1 Tax=Pseudomonas sp. Gutcm_11s TaxID=3026088 RepID=UPI002361658A|nr:TonB-dependent receptor [Pseudomonas sp. Gutcm_11s]MDD0844880.1 TonB-dependent siderophore receptor [Pseudomonas sp. Gutcm_11s]
MSRRSSYPARVLRPTLLALSLTSILPTAWAQSYAIPAGPLDAALSRFAAANGVMISFGATETDGLSSPGLQGDFELEQGFAQLLEGSDLRVQRVGEKRYVLIRATEDSSALALDSTTISAAELGSTTEDSGSYTTGQMSTATKLTLSMRETPQAVTVMTRQRMDDQAMTSITDVVQNTPGLFLSKADGPGRPSFSARGFDIDNVMYDGLPSYYQGWLMGAQPNLAMFDRVEVIRGATGLVSGSGNPSAAINLVRKRPTSDPRVSLTTSAGSWDDYRGEVDASGALNDAGTLRGRVVGAYRDANSFRDEEEHDHGLFYAISEADLTENTTLAVGFSRQEDQTNLFWGGLPIGVDGRHLDLSRSSYPGSDWENKELKINTLFTDLEHRFDNDWKLRLSAMHSWQDGLFSGTYLRRDAALDMYHQAFQARYDEDHDAFDLYASGPLELFGRRHEVVAGVSQREYDKVTHSYSGGGMIAVNAPKPDFLRNGKSEEVTTQEGAYLTTRLSLADPLTLILGGRLDWYEYDNRDAEGDYKVTRNVTRYSGLVYDLDQHHSLYASYTDVFQPQSAKDASQKVLAPIVGENYELGIKGEYFGGALNASLAVFQVDQQNRAVTDYDAPLVCDGWYCSKASGSVRSQGLDMELQGALSENWQVGAGFTYTRARYRHDADESNEGERFDSDAPERLFKLTSLYHLPGELDKWRVGGTLYWQSRVYNDVDLPSGDIYRLEQGSYATVDLLAGYRVNEHLDLQLNVNNVLDRNYYSGIGYDIYWGSTDTYGDPRSYLLTAKYDF